MPGAVPVVTLLTDFGTADYSVAAVKGVLLSDCPGVTLVDLTHDVPPGDVETAAFLLGAAARWFPAGTVHLVVVDPGVGSGRRILAVRGVSAVFVGPDNGVLDAVLADTAVHSVAADRLFRPGPGETFHGRDRFAPVAAYLAAGGRLGALGPTVADPVRLGLPRARKVPGGACGRVAHIDRFGNLVTDLPAEWLLDRQVGAVHVAGREITLGVRHYAEIPAGTAAWMVGSLGTVELARPGESLARGWGVSRGEPVELAFR